jgi:hypothetical protein
LNSAPGRPPAPAAPEIAVESSRDVASPVKVPGSGRGAAAELQGIGCPVEGPSKGGEPDDDGCPHGDAATDLEHRTDGRPVRLYRLLRPGAPKGSPVCDDERP